MTSDDLARVTSAVLAFDLGDVLKIPTPVAQAWSNAVYRVDTTRGTFAVKLFSPSLSADQQQRLRRGTAVERMVVEQKLIPVPQPIARHSDWIVELANPADPAGSRLARCHAWVNGAAARAPLSPTLVAQAGTYLGRLHAMHQIDGNTSQLPRLDLDRWQRAVRSAADRDLPFASHLVDLTPLVVALQVDLDELRRQRRPMRSSHNDYDPKNTVISQTDQLVVTDWDYAGPVLPGVELIASATSFAAAEDDIKTFVRAYIEAGGDAFDADPLAMTAELADLDWILRNVEAFTETDQSTLEADARTVHVLLADLPSEVESLRAWPQRVSRMLGKANQSAEGWT